MYGSNDFGSSYYGQGPAEGTTFTLHTISTSVVALATISTKLLINHAVSASVTAVASITRRIMRTLSADVTAVGSISAQIILGLTLRKAATKFLNMFRSSKGVAGFKNETKLLNVNNSTKRITESQ